MRNKTRRRTIVMDGVHYFADRPETCCKCFFWKNRKAGCILGRENCYYLAEMIRTEQEKKCENCCYARDRACVSAVCYKELNRWMIARRKQREGDVNA